MVKHVNNKEELGCIIDFFGTGTTCPFCCACFRTGRISSSNNFSWRQPGVRVAHALTVEEILQVLGKLFSYAFDVHALDHRNSGFWAIIGEFYSVEGLNLQIK